MCGECSQPVNEIFALVFISALQSFSADPDFKRWSDVIMID